jgi:5-methylcytosine-specific restriction endonuclease McrA
MTALCPTCGEEFDTAHGMRIHHFRAHGERLPNRTCRSCGKQFYDDESKRTYCDACDPPTIPSGKDNPNWKGGKPEKRCDYCSETYRTYRDNRFCSRGCYSSARRKPTAKVVGFHPTLSIRRQARERDNHACRSCGTTRDDLGQEPDVHHIVPVRDHDEPEQAHKLDNVICLCRGCHRKVEVGDLEIASAHG